MEKRPCGGASALVVEQGCPPSLGDAPTSPRDYFIATALTCRRSVTPASVLRTPSWTSVVMPSALACEHLGHAAPRLNEALDLVADDEQLVNARAASVPRAIAPRAALAARQHEVVGVSMIEGLERLLAVRVGQLLVLRALGMVGLPAPLADALDESLREDPEQRVGEVEGIEPHVEETHDGLDRAVGVERREDEMAGERRLDARVRGLLVAHLAHHDDVWVRVQEGRHVVGEREIEL